MCVNFLSNRSNLIVLFQVIIICYLTMKANAETPPCNKSQIQLSDLINTVFDMEELPSDLSPLRQKLANTNATLLLENCSSILTLKHYLFDHIIEPSEDDLPVGYYTALYTYAGMKYNILRHTKYVPRTNADIIFLTNSFVTANLKPVLGRKVHLYFFHYGNWLEKLTQSNFSFDNYKNPRSLLLDIICELINDPIYRVYEREAIIFLIVNNHVCSFIKNSYMENFPTGYHKPKDNNNNNPDRKDAKYTSKWPLVENQHYFIVSRIENGSSQGNANVKSLNSSSRIILFQNISTAILNDKILSGISLAPTKNPTKLVLNFSCCNTIKPTVGANHRLFKSGEPLKMTTERSFLSLSAANTAETLAPDRPEILEKTLRSHPTTPELESSTRSKILQDKNVTEMTSSTISEQTGQGSSYHLVDVVDHSNSSQPYVTHFNQHQYSYQEESKHEHNLSVWDIVEMDGPCKEGQQHVVKLNVQSLLTAVDEHVSSESLELFRKLLSNVKTFPTEDYNARGELLRDLLPAISKEQADPLIKKSMQDILDHVILDGPGALPPKIKLECMDVAEENIKRISRRTRRVFNIRFS